MAQQKNYYETENALRDKANRMFRTYQNDLLFKTDGTTRCFTSRYAVERGTTRLVLIVRTDPDEKCTLSVTQNGNDIHGMVDVDLKVTENLAPWYGVHDIIDLAVRYFMSHSGDYKAHYSPGHREEIMEGIAMLREAIIEYYRNDPLLHVKQKKYEDAEKALIPEFRAEKELEDRDRDLHERIMTLEQQLESLKRERACITDEIVRAKEAVTRLTDEFISGLTARKEQ